MALAIYVVEADDASSFKLYDQSTWTAYDHDKLTAAVLTVVYDGTTYTHNVLAHLGGGPTLGSASSVNMVGESLTSYYTVSPADLLNGSTPLNDNYFPDGYYEITLEVTYDSSDLTDTTTQGFLSEGYLMASQLPLQIDIENFDYEENRLQFLAIALYQSAKWAGELGRENSLTTITDKLNSFLDARSISSVWS